MTALNLKDYRTLSLAALGGALEFYDFIIFIYFAATIGALFFPPDIPDWLRQMQVLGIFAAGYLIRPVGGIVMAHYGDLFGRKRIFIFSVFLMAVPTLSIGLLPTYQDIGLAAPLLLLVLRLFQGAAVGGEVPGAWVFVAEHVSPRHLGFACGTLSAGLTAGILLGSLAANATHAIFNASEVPDFAWRIPFFIGGAFGLLSVWLRRYLHETPVFLEMENRKRLAVAMPLKTVLFDYAGQVFRSMGMTWLLSASIIVIILMMPMMMQKIGAIPVVLSLQLNAFATLALMMGCATFGLMADRFGMFRVLSAGCLMLALLVLALFWRLPSADGAVFVLYLICSFMAGVVGLLPAIMVKIFPPEIRFSGISFSYNIAYAVLGGITPIALGFVLMYDAMMPGYYVAALALLGIALAKVKT